MLPATTLGRRSQKQKYFSAKKDAIDLKKKKNWTEIETQAERRKKRPHFSSLTSDKFRRPGGTEFQCLK